MIFMQSEIKILKTGAQNFTKIQKSAKINLLETPSLKRVQSVKVKISIPLPIRSEALNFLDLYWFPLLRSAFRTQSNICNGTFYENS